MYIKIITNTNIAKFYNLIFTSYPIKSLEFSYKYVHHCERLSGNKIKWRKATKTRLVSASWNNFALSKLFFSEEGFGASPQGMGDEHYSKKRRQDRRRNKDRHHRSTTETACKQIFSCKVSQCLFSVCLNGCLLIWLSVCLGACLSLFLHLCLSEIFCLPAYLRALTSNRAS